MDKGKLIDEIALACEKAFRRGFMHGVVSKATEEQAYQFRFAEITESNSPPGMPVWKSTLKARLSVENSDPDSEIQGLLSETKALDQF